MVALLAMCGLSVQAQSWTASEVGVGEFYLYNVGTGQFFTIGNGWGTQASITTDALAPSGQKLILEAVGTDYKLRTDVNGTGFGVEHLSGGTIYTDQSQNKNSSWTFTQITTDNGPVYTIVSANDHTGGAGVYMTAGVNGTIVTPGTDGTIAGAQWKLLPAAKAPIVASLDRYTTIKAAAKAIISNLDTTTPDADVAAATKADEVEEAIVTLRAAFLAELPNLTIPADPGYIDVTAAMVDNAGVHTNTDYWTITNLEDTWGSVGVCNYGECELYYHSFKFYQTLAMKKGTWEFGVTGFHRDGNHNTHFYAGEDKILIPGVANTIVNDMEGAKTYFDNGNGKVALKFIIESDQNVEIGIDNQDTETDKWTIFRDFTLKYYGPVDYSVYDQQWADAFAAAEAAMNDDANANVTVSELTEINNAILDAPDGSSKANYLEKIQALEAATQAFTTAKTNYDIYAKERALADAISKDIVVDAPTSAENALVQFRALKVAEYNYVKTAYPYSATSKIGDFNGWTRTGSLNGSTNVTFIELTSQHWSGATMTYYEQPENGWSDNPNTTWTANYEKVTTLPAGSYIIKVAARAASGSGTTAKITCSAATIEGPIFNLGGTGKGITADGVASFDEDEFCNDGNGYGWVWNYLPFTLTAETEVTMTVVAEANGIHQWFSVCDGELLSITNIATAVAYNETTTNTIEDVDVANVTMTRTIKEGYNTFVLPFDLTAAQVASAFGTGTEVYNYSENSDEANDVTINFNNDVTGTIKANTPVLIKATVASTSQTFNGVQVVAATEAKVEGTYFDFIGTYAPIEAISAGDYFIGNGALYKSEGATSIYAFRAYIKKKSGNNNARIISFAIDDKATAIEGIEIEGAKNRKIYNLNGQEVKNPQKGVYIQNGKTIIIK